MKTCETCKHWSKLFERCKRDQGKTHIDCCTKDFGCIHHEEKTTKPSPVIHKNFRIAWSEKEDKTTRHYYVSQASTDIAWSPARGAWNIQELSDLHECIGKVLEMQNEKPLTWRTS